MTDTDPAQQHNSDGGPHLCLFCRLAYHCTAVHETVYDSVRLGARCCPECRRRNLIALDKLETKRRQVLYA